MNITSYFWL